MINMTNYAFTVIVEADGRKEALRALCRVVSDATNNPKRTHFLGMLLDEVDEALLDEIANGIKS